MRSLRPWLALFALLAFGSGCSPSAPEPTPGGSSETARNLILISIDTLRADRLGAYGYARPTSPTLDRLASRGVRYETVIAEASWTLPSHVTLFTGLTPSQHRVHTPGRRLAAHVSTLPEALKEQGFHTVGVTGGVFLARRYGFERGFDRFSDRELPLDATLALAAREIESLPIADRFFAFVHTYAVHCPYDPPADYAARFDREPAGHHIETAGRCGNSHFNAAGLSKGQIAFLSDRYDAGIRYADDRFGAFLTRLEESGRLDGTLVAVVSDHGEEFDEHGRIGHVSTLFMESLRIPWIMAGPGVEPAVVTDPVGLADVAPVLWAALGLQPPEEPRPAPPGAREGDLFSHNDWQEPLSSLVSGDHHAIYRRRSKDFLLFDWRADPLERTDLSGRDRALDRSLQERLFAQIVAKRPPGAAPFESIEPPEPTDLDRLRALGYVE